MLKARTLYKCLAKRYSLEIAGKIYLDKQMDIPVSIDDKLKTNMIYGKKRLQASDLGQPHS